MAVDHEYFDINVCLNSQGEFLDMTGRAGVLLNVEVPAVGGLRRVRPQVAWFLQTATFGRSLSGFWCAAIRLNASLFSLGEFLDANDGQEGLLDAEAPAFVESFDVNDGAMVLKGSPWTLENRPNLWRRKGRKQSLGRITTFSATSSAFGGADV